MDIEGDARFLSHVLVFGWTGAPGSYVTRTRATRGHHECREPAPPHWHGVSDLRSEWRTGDPVVVEPGREARAWKAGDAPDAVGREVFAAEVVNASGREAVGEPAPAQTAWSTIVDFAKKHSALREPKTLRVRDRLVEPDRALGRRSV